MRLTHEDQDQVTIMTLRGEFTEEDVDQFRRTALERIGHQIRDFVLDFSAVNFIDSKGLETLLWLQDLVREQLGQVRLAQVSENLEKILEMTRLAADLDCQDSVEATVASLR